MHLSYQEIQRANKKRENIIQYFLKDVRLCNDCGGTGLKGLHRTSDGDTCWDSSSYCDKCKGVGFLYWKETLLEKLCSHCDGSGRTDNFLKCKYCNGEGIVDWIQYIKNGRKK